MLIAFVQQHLFFLSSLHSLSLSPLASRPLAARQSERMRAIQLEHDCEGGKMTVLSLRRLFSEL